MSTTTNLNTLKINYLTEAQYDAEVQGGTVDENALYMTPDSGGSSWTDVTSQITLTEGANCTSVALNTARRMGNLLMLKFTVNASGIATGGNVDITYSGLPLLSISDYRVGFGVTTTSFYLSWLTSATNIRCRMMTSGGWPTGDVIFTGLLLLA